MDKKKDILERLKNMFTGDKKIENIVVLVILLVVLLISINFIFSGKKENKDKVNDNNTEKVENTNSTSVQSNINSSGDKDDMEAKLTSILNKISGITEASVMISYSTDTKKIPVYDTKQQENVSQENEKTTSQKIIEKSVAYEEVNGKKQPIVESNEMPVIEGVIVVAKGVYSTELKNKIITAVAAVTNVPIYKVQVFERQ